jgi:8-oxo-dGTP pyrophosphatase MutT (NUDIX family)
MLKTDPMQLSAVIDTLSKRLNDPLPGLAAQQRMYPHANGALQQRPPGTADRKSAVLVLIFPFEGKPHLLFTLRNAGLKHHSGQISFPGGMIEAGETPEQAALREAYEETGLDASMVTVLGRLTDVEVLHSRNHVIPVVGYCTKTPALEPDPAEVSEIIPVPLHDILNPGLRKVREATFEGKTWSVPYFDIHTTPLWGATAIMTIELVALLEGAARG